MQRTMRTRKTRKPTCTPKSQFLQHLPKSAVNYNSIKNKQLHTIPCPYFLINLCKRKIKILFFFSKSRCQIKKLHSKQCPVPHLGRDQLERRCLKVTCTHLSSSGIGAPADTRCRAGDTPSHLSLLPQ